VELDDVTRKLDETIAEGVVVEGVSALCGAVDGLDVVDGNGEVVVAGRLQVSLEEVQLGATHGEPLDRDGEVGRRDRLCGEQLDIEVGRPPEVERSDHVAGLLQRADELWGDNGEITVYEAVPAGESKKGSLGQNLPYLAASRARLAS